MRVNFKECKPIFVVGTPRAGTTLLGRILGRHDDILLTRESFFFEDIWSRRQRFDLLDQQEKVEQAVKRFQTLFQRYQMVETQKLVDQHINLTQITTEIIENGADYDAIYYLFLEKLAQSEGKRYFCDDTPNHLFYFQAIIDYFPNAKVIGVSRDPRNFLCSYKNYWQHSEDPERIKALYHPISTSFMWRTAAKLMHNYSLQYPNNFLQTKYETIVNFPDTEINRICQFIGVDYLPSMLEVTESNSSFSRSRSTSGIFTSSLDRWRGCLSEEELWWVQMINRPFMQSFDYEIASGRPNPLKIAQDTLSFPLRLLKALHANRQYRGPLLPYLKRRLGALMGRSS